MRMRVSKEARIVLPMEVHIRRHTDQREALEAFHGAGGGPHSIFKERF